MTIKKKGIDFMVDLFEATRNHSSFKEVILPIELVAYASKVYSFYGQSTQLIIPDGELDIANKEFSNMGIFTLSGGKDSLAVFLKNKDRFNNVACFYIQGITPYVKEEERKGAERIAQELGVELKLLDLGFDGNTSLAESVIKNQMIYSLVMDKLTNLPRAIGFGGTNELGPQSMCFYHDHPESFDLFYKFAIKSWGKHELIPFVKDELESYQIIYDLAPNLINMISSCMTPADKKESVRNWVQTEFAVNLDNNYQCGACYKCAEEQIIAKEFHERSIPEKYVAFCKSVVIDKCLFEKHNLNGLIPADYLSKLNITSVKDLLLNK